MPKNTYTKEFKEQAVLLVLEAGNTRTKVCEDLKISASALNKWICNYKQGSSVIKELTAEQKQIRELQKELEQAQIERDILKKAAAFFSKDSL